jgi:hypothetical protein
MLDEPYLGTNRSTLPVASQWGDGHLRQGSLQRFGRATPQLIGDAGVRSQFCITDPPNYHSFTSPSHRMSKGQWRSHVWSLDTRDSLNQRTRCQT